METSKLVQAFETELNLTEVGLLALTEQKKGLVIDVSTDSGFKLARKERTEQNKIIKNIDDLAISGKRSVDEARAVLKDRVSSIYSPIVTAFEAENIRRKEITEQKKRDEESRINAIREQINSIRQFSTNLLGKSSAELQEIIEAVDMIDVSESFAELTQEAMLVKKETLSELNCALSSAIQNEQLAIEREALHVERLAQEETNRINDLKARSQERLNTLIMMPSKFFGKTSSEIKIKIDSLYNYKVKEEEFGELFDQANKAKESVIEQLVSMAKQQDMVEKSCAGELARIEADKPKNNQDFVAQNQVDIINPAGPVASEIIEEAKELTNHEQMINQVNFWAKEYGVVNSEYSDLINILNQYK